MSATKTTVHPILIQSGLGYSDFTLPDWIDWWNGLPHDERNSAWLYCVTGYPDFSKHDRPGIGYLYATLNLTPGFGSLLANPPVRMRKRREVAARMVVLGFDMVGVKIA